MIKTFFPVNKKQKGKTILMETNDNMGNRCETVYGHKTTS